MFVVVITLVIYSADRSGLSADYNATSETLTLSAFFVEYEKYCSTQLLPKASNIASSTVVSGDLCHCVPDTLGKCLFLWFE